MDRASENAPRLPAPHDIEEDLAAYRLPDGSPLELFRVLAYSPAALADLRAATARALHATSLDVRTRELIVVRVLDRLGAASEVAVHLALFGVEAAIGPADVDALSEDRANLKPDERDLIGLADALVAGGDIDDDLWGRLLTTLGPGGLVDALFVGTQYVKVALLVRALRIPNPQPKENDT